MARKALQPEVLFQEFQEQFNAVSGGKPLECALVCAATIEQSLMSLLMKKLTVGSTSKSLFNEGAILGEYSRCAKLAYALGLMPKEVFQNIIAIGEIRNLFAHSHIELTFESPDIRSKILGLKLQSAYMEIDEKIQNVYQDLRLRFGSISVQTSHWLIQTAHSIEHIPESTDKW